MDFEQLLEHRYTTKHYDSTRKVPDETVTKILECVRLTPTSVNAQPYHFYVLTGAAKDSLRPAIMDFNLQRYDGASHAIVITSQTAINEEHLAKVLAAEEQAGRLPTEDIKAAQDKSRHYFCNLHVTKGDFTAWTGKQAYSAFATLVYAAASYGVDSTALEGIEFDQVDSIMKLADKHETCALIVVLGYRAADDSNQLDKRPKSRLALADLVTYLN